MSDLPTLKERATAWMDANPEAMKHFAAFAEQLRQRGRRFGMKLLAERVRWELTLRGGAEDFKINNNHVAYVSRRLITDDPRLAEHIKCRITKAANLPARASVIASEVNPLTGAVL